jgi:N-acetyl-beta-hexosaminidase
MAAEGLDDEAALQSWFIRRIGDWLHVRGRQLVGWDEMLEGGVEGLASNAIVMSWRVRIRTGRIYGWGVCPCTQAARMRARCS